MLFRSMSDLDEEYEASSLGRKPADAVSREEAKRTNDEDEEVILHPGPEDGKWNRLGYSVAAFFCLPWQLT